MSARQTYVEENFGILTDDDLYLDAILVKPTNLIDENLRVLRVWVPKYPMTKSSTITCARQEVHSYGADGRIAHLVFDLRGTGDSDGDLSSMNFKMDLRAVSAWAVERFGKNINFGYLGTPTLHGGSVNMWPIRVGVFMESYYFPAMAKAVIPPTVIYLSSYGHFGRTDEKMCLALAKSGYNVYGLDPLRYLLHASAQDLLTPEQLYEDLSTLLHMLPSDPIVIGNPLAAGLAMIWGVGVHRVRGVIAIGRAQSGLQPPHIFNNANPYTFLLSRKISDISPRSLAIVYQKDHPLGGEEDKLEALFKSSKAPHRFDTVSDISPQFLQELLAWVESK